MTTVAYLSAMPQQQQSLDKPQRHQHRSSGSDLGGGHPIQESSRVEAVRVLLPAELQAQADDATVQRFLRAVGGAPQEAAKRLQATLLWRQQVRPEHIVCHACTKDPRSHYMHVVGYDLMQRPIIYSCFAAATNRVYKDNLDHMLQTFETAIKCMPPGVEQWVWACDFHGFGMADVSPKLARAFLNISAEHYPERLGMFLILDAPSLFGMLWRAIQSFVDPKTYTKIRFLPYDPTSPKSQLRGTLSQLCDAPTADWIVTEMTENRDSKKVPHKTYSLPHIHKAASQGDLSPLPDGQHDMRGTPSLLQHYLSSPAVLEPQASAAGRH